jgi:hypothetical protein
MFDLLARRCGEISGEIPAHRSTDAAASKPEFSFQFSTNWHPVLGGARPLGVRQGLQQFQNS